MPVFTDKCCIKKLFSIGLKHNFNSFVVDKVFKHAELALVVGHEDGVVRTYELPGVDTEVTQSSAKCTASFETKGGPIQALVVHDVTKLSGFGDVVTSDSRGVVTVFSNEHILCRKAISDHSIACLQIDQDATGNFGIVTADREGSMCAFTPYFDMWRLRLLDVKPSKGLGGRLTVTCMQAVELKSADGHVANYILVADERQLLYFIHHGTVVLVLQTPAVITAMCCGRFVSSDDIETTPSPSASSAQPQQNAAFDTQVALATDTGSIYIMTNFQDPEGTEAADPMKPPMTGQTPRFSFWSMPTLSSNRQIYQEPYANIHLPINHLRAFPTQNIDLLLAAGNSDSFTVLSPEKVVASYQLPTWACAVALADIDKDGIAEVIIGCRNNCVYGLRIAVS